MSSFFSSFFSSISQPMFNGKFFLGKTSALDRSRRITFVNQRKSNYKLMIDQPSLISDSGHTISKIPFQKHFQCHLRPRIIPEDLVNFESVWHILVIDFPSHIFPKSRWFEFRCLGDITPQLKNFHSERVKAQS